MRDVLSSVGFLVGVVWVACTVLASVFATLRTDLLALYERRTFQVRADGD